MSPVSFIDDPDWAKCIPEMREDKRTRHLPSHEDCSSLNVELAAGHLRSGGTLGAMSGYEERPGQIDMLSAIARAFNAREHLMIEAGTGVGKSLAYLIPSILWAWTNDTPVVISTATRNLQSQLIGSDIPRALKILGDEAPNFKVALLKGRSNYLCLRAVADFFAGGYYMMSTDDQLEMPAFVEWLQSTPDGDLDQYSGLPRILLSCPGEECSVRRCPYYTRCFVYKARKAAAAAHLVIVNHALVMAEAVSSGGGILPSYGRLVLDEAHNLEDIATEYLSYEFSLPALTRILNRLMRRAKNRRARAGGLLASVQRQIQKGLLVESASRTKVNRALADIGPRVVDLMNAADGVFDVAALLLRPAGKDEICRYRMGLPREDGSVAREFSLHGLFQPYPADIWQETTLLSAQNDFEAALARLVNLLHELRDALENSAPEGEFNFLGDLASQAGSIAESLVEFANEANFVLRGNRSTHVYWAERVRIEKRPSHLRLVAAPLSVAEDLRKMFYETKDSVILSSATLRVGNDFKFMARRLGCVPPVRGDEPPSAQESRFRFLVASSPFDYLNQSLCLAADCMTDPKGNAAKYAQELAVFLRDLFTLTHARALVLFTSYEMMNNVAASSRDLLSEAGIRLLVQGEGMSRESMTRELKNSNDVVLFGAQSFWEGVDVAGDALSCVVVTRLPFAQVGDPIVEARCEKIERDGGKAFHDYSLPEAVIKFRQGFGRLIRTKSDRGVVIVTDPRLVTKNYGATFRRSIPTSVHTVTDLAELLSRVENFL